MVLSVVKSLLQKDLSYKVTGTLWIECEGERFFGPGRVELLERIEETGSINKAAKQMGMSYKKAWAMVRALNSQVSQPFVVTQTGGEKGQRVISTSSNANVPDVEREKCTNRKIRTNSKALWICTNIATYVDKSLK